MEKGCLRKSVLDKMKGHKLVKLNSTTTIYLSIADTVLKRLTCEAVGCEGQQYKPLEGSAPQVKPSRTYWLKKKSGIEIPQ
jgi:hypothetical protein